MAEPLRAATYCRVSTDDQARDGYGLPDQRSRTTALAVNEGWQLAGTFEDAGRSGSDGDRPGLAALIAEVAADRIDVVIVAALDRLSRDAGHLRELLLTFDAAGVRLLSARETIDHETPEGRLQTGILAEFSEFERAKIRARTSAGIGSRAKSGKP